MITTVAPESAGGTRTIGAPRDALDDGAHVGGPIAQLLDLAAAESRDRPVIVPLVLATYDPDENIVDALRAGASGFLVKDTGPAELLDAVRTVAAGEALLSPGSTARLTERFPRSPSPPVAAGPDCLSDREREVLALVARGPNNTEIAEPSGLSPLTAKTRVSRITGKLGARDRAQLVIVAHESGLVAPGRP
ncbi:LuxR C-terminal-related transcriptional regulator [Streptomyces viridosporus]